MLFEIEAVRLDKGLPLPVYSQPGDAGVDLFSAIDYVLSPGTRKLIPTGISFAIPLGYVGLIHPRSGLAHKHGVSVVNAPGTIDSGYRGEIFVNLINLDLKSPYVIERGSRIAQIVFQPVVQATLREVSELPSSERGEDGHGSTGVKSRFAEGGVIV